MEQNPESNREEESLEEEDLDEVLHTPRPLPVGVKESDEWSDIIIKYSGLAATPDSMKWTLSAMILQLGPTEAFKPISYFISRLRKAAADQVAQQVMEDLKAKKQAQIKAEDVAKADLEKTKELEPEDDAIDE